MYTIFVKRSGYYKLERWVVDMKVSPVPEIDQKFNLACNDIEFLRDIMIGFGLSQVIPPKMPPDPIGMVETWM